MALSLDSNTARHGALSWGVFACKQATMRFSSGIAAPQSRNTSGVHAICCSMVPRCSCAAADPTAIAAAKPMAKIRKICCFGMAAPSSSAHRSSIRKTSSREKQINEAGTGSYRTTKRERAKNERASSAVIYSTLPMRFTAATRRALSVSTNFANSGASM